MYPLSADRLGGDRLVQLTLGGPSPIYKGGLLHTRLRYFTGLNAHRPGLPRTSRRWSRA